MDETDRTTGHERLSSQRFAGKLFVINLVPLDPLSLLTPL